MAAGVAEAEEVVAEEVDAAAGAAAAAEAINSPFGPRFFKPGAIEAATCGRGLRPR